MDARVVLVCDIRRGGEGGQGREFLGFPVGPVAPEFGTDGWAGDEEESEGRQGHPEKEGRVPSSSGSRAADATATGDRSSLR